MYVATASRHCLFGGNKIQSCIRMIKNDAKNTGQVELETDFNKNKNISTTKFPTIALYIFRTHCKDFLEDAKVALKVNVIRSMQETLMQLRNKQTYLYEKWIRRIKNELSS